MTDPTLLVQDGALLMQRCTLYGSPGHASATVENHHICPKSWFQRAGRPADTPMIVLCPNCHGTVHAAIDALIKGRDVRALPPRCVRLARQALQLAETRGLTPTLTL